MKLNTAPMNPAEMSAGLESSGFNIKASAKAFDILSSGLYSDKIRAIIRELSCNAYDSHVAAGRPELPFTVHLPTTLHPYFYVRDYGVGLDHEEVTQIYTTYFESTKTDSDDYIGALGLGSKSPFSYTDNFTVTAIKNGVKRLYSAYINDHGVPSIVKLGENPTDESNGVEVRFSVTEVSEFSTFLDRAQTVYKWFKTKPEILGAQIEISDIDDLIDQRDIIPGVHTMHHQRNSLVVMGNVAYSIDSNDFPKASLSKLGIDNSTINRLSNYLNMRLLINLNIGEVEPAASREVLSYTPSTVKRIVDILLQIENNIESKFFDGLDKIENEWERIQEFGRRASSQIYSHLVNNIGKSPALNGLFSYKFIDAQNLNSYRYSRNIINQSLTFRGAQGANSVRLDQQFNDLNLEIERFVRYYSYTGINKYALKKDAMNNGSSFVINVEKNKTRFVWNTNGKKLGVRVRNQYNVNKDWSDIGVETVYVLQPIDKTKPFDKKKIEEFFVNPPSEYFVDETQLLPSPKTKSTRDLSSTYLVGLSYQKSSKRSYYNEWVFVDESLKTVQDEIHNNKSKKIYYVKMNGYDAYDHNDKIIDLKSLVDSLRKSGIKEFTDIKIYGVRKKDWSIIKGSKWVQATKYIKSFLESQPIGFWEVVKLNTTTHSYNNSDRAQSIIVMNHILDRFSNSISSIDLSNLDKNCALVVFQDTVKLVFQMTQVNKINRDQGLAILNVAKFMEHNVDASIDDLLQKIKLIRTAYPLIDLFNKDLQQKHVDEFIKYAIMKEREFIVNPITLTQTIKEEIEINE